MAERIIVEDLHEFGRVELAAKYKSTAASQAQYDKVEIDRLERDLMRDGYVVVPDIIDRSTLDAITQDVRPRFRYPGGRNNFEGFKTQRLYAVLAKTLICNSIVEHALALSLLDRVLLPNYLLSQLQVIDILPGEERQPFHFDDAMYPFSRPRAALGAASIVAIDEFTEANGATVIIPGSHLWDERSPTQEDLARAVPVVMPPGAMVFFLGTLWHAGGANRTDKPRLCVTAQYCEPYLRTQENYFLGLPVERVRAMSESMQRLLGFSIHRPFIGMVDGKHPKRLLENDPER